MGCLIGASKARQLGRALRLAEDEGLLKLERGEPDGSAAEKEK
jgi:hypothetical protein